MVKIGAITIGQAPRNDVTVDILPILGDNIELIQAGGLDGLTHEEIAAFAPDEHDYVLVSKLVDGTSVKFAERFILPRLQKCIDVLEKEGVSLILFLCTGDFPNVLKSHVPLIFPYKIIKTIVPVLSTRSKIAVLTPDAMQVKQSEKKWKNYVSEVISIPASPYANPKELDAAAERLKDLDVDLIVMDCIGYTEKMKQDLRARTQKNIILSRTIVARLIKELLD